MTRVRDTIDPKHRAAVAENCRQLYRAIHGAEPDPASPVALVIASGKRSLVFLYRELQRQYLLSRPGSQAARRRGHK
jgi:hypothetical protein